MSDADLSQSDDATITKQAKAGSIRNDRGTKITQLDPVRMRLLRQTGDMDRAALDAMFNELGTGFNARIKSFVPLFIGSACLLLIVAIITTVDVVQSGDLSQIVNGRNVALINIWFWPFMIWPFARRHRYAKIKTVMLEHRHCPHCGYPLRGLRPDEHDGATVCPECGCAWSLKDRNDD